MKLGWIGGICVSVLIYPELQDAVLLRRLVEQLDATTELYATRQAWPASGVALLLQQSSAHVS